MHGKPILRYLRSAEHLTELRLYSERFVDIKVNDFYEQALEIIEKRENGLSLNIYHRGETVARRNGLKLKLFHIDYHTSKFCQRCVDRHYGYRSY